MRTFFSFPDTVDERAVRITAGGVALIAALALGLQRPELVGVLAYGFVARVLAGPRLSPLALLSTRIVSPRLRGRPRYVAGPPKRFAQALGASVSLSALLLYYLGGLHTAAWVLVAMMVGLATLEAAAGICVGCVIYAALVRNSIVDGVDCPECADVRLRIGATR